MTEKLAFFIGLKKTPKLQPNLLLKLELIDEFKAI